MSHIFFQMSPSHYCGWWRNVLTTFLDPEALAKNSLCFSNFSKTVDVMNETDNCFKKSFGIVNKFHGFWGSSTKIRLCLPGQKFVNKRHFILDFRQKNFDWKKWRSESFRLNPMWKTTIISWYTSEKCAMKHVELGSIFSDSHGNQLMKCIKAYALSILAR